MIIFLSIMIIVAGVCNYFLAREVFKLRKKAAKPMLSKQDEKKLEKARKAFNNLMEYGYEEALKRK